MLQISEDAPQENAATRRKLVQLTSGSKCNRSHVMRVSSALLLIGVCIVLVRSYGGHFQDLSNFVRNLGVWGHVMFFMYFLFVGLPFGYNYSAAIAAVGYAYGWYGMLDAQIGSLVSALCNFFLVRRCGRQSAQGYIEGLSPEKRRYAFAVKASISRGYLGAAVQVLLRLNPLFVFGLVNCILALTDTSIMTYALTSVIGTQYDLWVKLQVGILMHTAHSGTNRALMFELCMICVLMAAGVIQGRFVLRQMSLHDSEPTGETETSSRRGHGSVEMLAAPCQTLS